MIASKIVVSMSDIQIATTGTTLVGLGLGSCIGFCVYDPKLKIGGMAHIMLPELFKDKPVDKPGKFVDTAILELLRLFEEKGAAKNRAKIAYAGGAQVFQFGNNPGATLNIGSRNSAATEKKVKELQLNCVACDVGGTQGRTLSFNVETAEVTIKTAKSGEQLLCVLA